MENRSTYRGLLSRSALWIATFTLSLLFASCSSQYYRAATYGGDDMYATHDRQAIANKEAKEAAAYAQMMEQRREQWASELGMTSTVTNEELYNTPYGEKLLALSSTTYQKPSSYYELEYSETLDRLTAYDPMLYDATLGSNGDIYVEPKYAISMYGSWGDPYYTNYAWNYGYPTWGYYSSWGYPSYSFWDYSFGYSPYYYYNPWWGPYYYPGYGYGSWYGYGYYGWYNPYIPRPPYYHGSVNHKRVRRPIVNRVEMKPNNSNVEIGRRRRDGSTVGQSSSSSYNRGTSRIQPSYSNGGSSTRVTSPSISIPSSGGSSSGYNGRSTNSIGR